MIEQEEGVDQEIQLPDQDPDQEDLPDQKGLPDLEDQKDQKDLPDQEVDPHQGEAVRQEEISITDIITGIIGSRLNCTIL